MAPNLTTRAHATLRRQILTGELPAGSPLRLATLSGNLGVSMAVIREALSRLTEQGLVTSSPNQGFRVMSLSMDDLHDLTEVRVDLETLAFRRSIARGDLGWEGRVVAAHHELAGTPILDDPSHSATEAWMAAHAAFHDALYDGCGSPRLCGLVSRLRDNSEIYRQWGGRRDIEQGRDILGEHRRLMELALARQADEACAALTDHIVRTARSAEEAQREADQVQQEAEAVPATAQSDLS